MATATVRAPGRSVREDPAYQAFLVLRTGFVVAPILFGLDKFTNLLTGWTTYLAPSLDRLVPGTATGAMLAVGIIGNLLLLGDRYDVALRDFGLLLAALALARLATAFQPSHATDTA